MTLDEAIATGALPWVLEGGDWRRYVGREVLTFESMWGAIAWVRLQGFWRAFDAEEDARAWGEEWERS